MNKKHENKNLKKKNGNKKPINWTKLFTRIIVWFMLLVMIAFFITTIVWGLN